MPSPLRAPQRLRRLLVPRLILLCLLTALLAALAWLESWHWGFAWLRHLTPVYLCAGVLFAGSLWWLGRRRWALVGAALALAQLPLLVGLPATADGPCAATASDPLRLVQWNAHFSHARPADFLAWLERQPQLPHLVLILEAGSAWQPLLPTLRQRFPLQIAELRDDPFGILLLSRLPGSGEVTRFAGVPLPLVVFAGRGEQGRAFRFYGVHPPPPLDAAMVADQRRMAAELQRRIRQRPVEATLVAGDLNDTPWTRSMRRLLAESGLRNAFRWWQGSWPAWLPSWLGLPLDQLLVTGDLRLLQSRLGPAFGSDHRLRDSRVDLAVCRPLPSAD